MLGLYDTHKYLEVYVCDRMRGVGWLKASVAGDMTRQTRRSAVASSLILTQLLCHDGRCVAFLQQQPHCSRVDANKISAPISLQALSNGEKAEEREMIVGSSFVVDQNDAYVYNNMHLSEETPIISAKNSSLVMVLEEEEEHCYIPNVLHLVIVRIRWLSNVQFVVILVTPHVTVR